ncbi:MAG TPA: RNA polymerase sigma factor [Solirubrobacteraceae bacterium]|jgi:RNA polymerase sigma-70 factor (ECF subfamily)|nr:RNA polymerase sigma factor [Solirubrobacteraceae bacterium]
MNELEQWDDAALLADRRRPDASFSVFYRRHVETVLALCARAGLDAAAAADVTAETFTAALLSRRRHRPEAGAPRAWLLGIAAHKLADHGRRAARERRARRRLPLAPIALTERDVADYEALRALAQLPTGQREAVFARVVQDHDYATIGRDLQISETTARQRVSRGLAMLRARLSEEGKG